MEDTTPPTQPTNEHEILQQLEQEYVKLRSDRDALFQAKHTLQQKLQGEEEALSAVKGDLSDLKLEKVKVDGQVENLTVRLESVSEQLRHLQERGDRNASENDLLREELDKLQRSNAALQSQLDAAKVSEAGSSVNAVRFECERYKAECKALSDHSAYLEGEVKGVRGKLSSLKNDVAKKVLDFEMRLHSSSDAVFRLESDKKSMQERIESYQELVSSLQSKIAERDADMTSLTARLGSESNEHANLRLMYEHKYELLYSRMREADEHLKKMREEASASAASNERQRLEYEEQLVTLESQITKQAAIIEDTATKRARIDTQVLNLIPDSESGVKLTEIYDELVTKDDDLRQVKAEKAKIESTLKRLVSEMEKKAPIIAQRQKDFNAMKAKYGQIKSDYEELFEECSQLRQLTKAAEADSRHATLSSETTRRENIALANQVQNLLKAQIGTEVDSADAFTNIQELHNQNQHLLQRLLKAELETENLKNATEDKLVEANSVLNEFSLLKEEQKTQKEYVESLVQQRDMYRSLLSNHNSNALMLEDGENIQSKLSDVEGKLEEKDREITILNDKVERGKMLIDNLSKANEEVRNDTLQKSSELAKLDAKLSYSEAREKKLEQDLVEKSARLLNIEARNETTDRENEKLHQNSSLLLSQITDLNSKVADLQSCNQSLTVTKMSLESTMGRLSGEIAVLQNQKQQNENLYTSLQRIELQVQGESKSKLEGLEVKVTDLEEKLRCSVNKHELEEVQKQLTIKEVEVSTNEKEIVMLKKSLAEAKPAKNNSKDESDVVNKLAEVELELSESRKHLGTFKQMAKDFEELSNKINEDKSKIEKELSEKVEEVKSQKSALMDLTSSFENEKADLLSKITVQNSNISDLKSNIGTLTTSKECIVEELETVKQNLLCVQGNLAGMTSNYDRELALHSDCRKELYRLNKDKNDLLSSNEEFQKRFANLEARILDSDSSFNAMKSSLEAELAKKNSIIDDLRGKSGELNSKISDLVKKLTQEVESTDDATEDLRSVVAFQQNERRILDAEIVSLRGSLERESANLRIVQRALDEVRAELELQKKTPPIAQNQNNEQISLLTESNAHLRENNAQLVGDLAKLRKEITEREREMSPLQSKVETLNAKCNENEAEMDVLRKDAKAWKTRTRQIIENFAQIDPEEHEKLQKKVDTLNVDLKELKTSKIALETQSVQAKALLGKANKEISNLKTKLTESTATIQKMQNQHNESIKKVKDSESSAVSKELEEAKKALERTEQRANRLTAFLRKKKETLNEINKECVALRKEKDALTKSLESQENLVEVLKKESESLKSALAKHSESIQKQKLDQTIENSQIVTKNAADVGKVSVKTKLPSEPNSTREIQKSTKSPSLTIDSVVDSSVPSLPTNKLEFISGKTSKNQVSKLQTPEAEIRARLMLKKRKLEDKLAESQKLKAIDESKALGSESGGKSSDKGGNGSSSLSKTDEGGSKITDTKEPIAKRERTNEILLKGDFRKSPSSTDISSSPFLDLKPPSNTGTNILDLGFGASANIPLPVPTSSSASKIIDSPSFTLPPKTIVVSGEDVNVASNKTITSEVMDETDK